MAAKGQMAGCISHVYTLIELANPGLQTIWTLNTQDSTIHRDRMARENAQ